MSIFDMHVERAEQPLGSVDLGVAHWWATEFSGRSERMRPLVKYDRTCGHCGHPWVILTSHPLEIWVCLDCVHSNTEGSDG